MSLRRTGSRPVKGQYKKVSASEILLVCGVMLGIYVFGGRDSKIVQQEIDLKAQYPTIEASCKSAIIESVRQQRAKDPISVLDPDTSKMFWIKGVELTRKAKELVYQFHVSDNYSSSLTTYMCTATDKGAVISIAHE